MTPDPIVTPHIVPTDERYLESLIDALDSVARERRWLSMLEAPPVDACRAFVRNVITGGGVQMLAVDDEGTVLGWCDIVRVPRPARSHCGIFGMGLRRDHRGMGIGTRLATTTIAAAGDAGITRIELDVFASNAQALALYKRLGFIIEGVKRRAVCIDGVYEDMIFMALVDANAGSP